MTPSHLPAAVCFALATTLGIVAIAALGYPSVATDAVLAVCIVLLAHRVSRLCERLDVLQMPARECDWCGDWYRDPTVHAAHCDARHPQEP